MSLWMRTAILLGVLLAILLGAAAVSREPAIPASGTRPKLLRLVRVGSGEPAVGAQAVLVQRMKSGEVLFELNADERLPTASLTKLMTALLLVEVGQPLARVAFSEAAKTAGAPDDKRSAVQAGDALRAEDVLKLLLISSDNDAAYAAAEYVGGLALRRGGMSSFQDRLAFFVDRMNERTQHIGFPNTHFSNPTGHDDPGNFSTAADTAALAEFIERTHPDLWVLTRVQETFVFGERGQRYGVVNTNPLLQEYPAIYGSKTGFDDEARGALLTLYQIAPGDLVAIVLLRSGDRFGDGRALIRWLESSFVLE